MYYLYQIEKIYNTVGNLHIDFGNNGITMYENEVLEYVNKDTAIDKIVFNFGNTAISKESYLHLIEYVLPKFAYSTCITIITNGMIDLPVFDNIIYKIEFIIRPNCGARKLVMRKCDKVQFYIPSENFILYSDYKNFDCNSIEFMPNPCIKTIAGKLNNLQEIKEIINDLNDVRAKMVIYE